MTRRNFRASVSGGRRHRPHRFAALLMAAGLLGALTGTAPAQEASPRIVQVATGNLHACALTDAGELWCWGDNEYGQLGDGTQESRDLPVRVRRIGDGVRAVATGEAHSCAINRDGRVLCWGKGFHGQLGNGMAMNSSVPVRARGLGIEVRSIAAGGSHSCAINRFGRAFCWGANDVGQLGNGTTANKFAPEPVTGLRRSVRAIAAGRGHSCAINRVGRAFCWGYNLHGQLGDGTNETRLAPVPVSTATPRFNLRNIATIATGDSHSCAVNTGGLFFCWGRNREGQLGLGDLDPRNEPAQVWRMRAAAAVGAGGDGGATTGMDGMAGVVSAGLWHSCGLHSNGSAYCWGGNGHGQLGIGAAGPPVAERTRVRLPRNATPGVVAAGGLFSCASYDDFRIDVACWGNNGLGSLGDGTRENSARPVRVFFPWLGD